MRIDNSRAKAFLECPKKYWWRYERNLEPEVRGEALPFGTRFHQLLEEHYKGVVYPPATEDIEDECQVTLAAYKAHYPAEDFDVVATEQFFEVPLPREKCNLCGGREFRRGRFKELICEQCNNEATEHTYIGEFDAIVRMHDTGRLKVFETKTEKRGGKGNLPEHWAMRSQVGLYIWAAEQVYNEAFDGIILNVVTRQSPAGREPCSFRRDFLERSDEDKASAVRNICWVADEIERLRQSSVGDEWPFSSEACIKFNWKCDYYSLDRFGESPETLSRYKEAQEYLAL